MASGYVARFIARRLFASVILLALVSFAAFALLTLAPGDPVDLLLADRPRTPELVASLRETYDLTGSFLGRFSRWAQDAVQLDFGESIAQGKPVMDVIRDRAPLTLQLAAMAFALVLVLGVPLGVAAAVRRGGMLDRVIVAATVIGVSAPPFVLGILLIYLFALTLGWLPSFGAGTTGVDRFEHLVLPAVALAMSTLAIVVKVTRSAMIRELDQDYVVFARARGHSRATVVSHALRNALIPVVTAGGLILGLMVGSAVLVEQVFALPGLGTLLVQAAENRDLPMLQGIVLVTGAVVIGLNLLADLLYLAIDPRVRFGEATE